MIHSTSEVKSKQVGRNTTIWQFCVVLNGASIGEDCNINAHVFIENDVIIGDRVTIKPGVQLWDGIRIKDDVFVGPNVTFTNDSRPRSKQYSASFLKTIVQRGASIGANATILPGLIIGKYSLIGAGTVVTKNVPNRALVVGNPGKIVGWMNTDGTKMIKDIDGWRDDQGHLWKDNDGTINLYE